MTQAVKKFYTPQEYLALEEKADYRSEYFRGEIFAMAGGSPNHNQIVLNIASLLNEIFQGAGKECEAFGSNLRIASQQTQFYTYPDASVVCGELELLEGPGYNVTNPVVIIEVLSESTSYYDHTGKFELYRTIPAIQDYVLIEQNLVYIEYFHKPEDRRWLLETYDNLNQTLKLQSIETELPLSRIYSRVKFSST
jgi:Uma2 family endonuclease